MNHSAFPQDLTDIATSLRLVTNRIQSRERLLVELAPSVDRFCTILAEEGGEPILAMFSQASSFVFGRRVSVDQGHSLLEGTTAGLNSSGFLILERDDGTKNVILAGGVRPCS